jgi:hypothetical protein
VKYETVKHFTILVDTSLPARPVSAGWLRFIATLLAQGASIRNWNKFARVSAPRPQHLQCSLPKLLWDKPPKWKRNASYRTTSCKILSYGIIFSGTTSHGMTSYGAASCRSGLMRETSEDKWVRGASQRGYTTTTGDLMWLCYCHNVCDGPAREAIWFSPLLPRNRGQTASQAQRSRQVVV